MKQVNLASLAEQGHAILSHEFNPEKANASLEEWTKCVTTYLKNNHSDSGFVPEWLSINNVTLPPLTSNINYPNMWFSFKLGIERRLAWLGGLPTKIRIQETLNIPLRPNPTIQLGTGNKLSTPQYFISPIRIAELEGLQSQRFDLKKLVALCKEINVSYNNECWFAVIALTRTIIHYVPPIFGQPNFESVVAQYNGKSIKNVLTNLFEVAKNIADVHLHGHAKVVEAKITAQQVSFGNQLDILLQEVYTRIMQDESC